MKKCGLILLLLLLVLSNLKAQSLTSAEWQAVIKPLSAEDWPNADKILEGYLKNINPTEIDDDQAAILRYMYIITQAGILNASGLDKAAAQKKVEHFTGHTVITPWSNVATGRAYNKILPVNDKTDTLSITAANKAATSIFAFVYIAPKQAPPLELFGRKEQAIGRIKGVLRIIKTEGNFLPRFRIIIDEAELEIKE